MLGETWNLVAEWGVETIKNIQTHIGLADEDEDRDTAPHANKGRRCMSLIVEEVEGSTQIAAIKAKQDTGLISAQVAVLEAQLTKPRQSNQAKAEKLREELAAVRARGYGNESMRVKALEASIYDLRNCKHEHEPESQRSEKADMQPVRRAASARQLGSVTGRRSTNDEILFQGRSFSAEGEGSNGIRRSPSASSSSTRTSPKSPRVQIPPGFLARSDSQRSLSKKKLLPADRAPWKISGIGIKL